MGRAIWIALLNIRLGRVGVLEAAIQALHQGNVGVRILQETKLTEGIHSWYGSGYAVWVMEAESRHRGGVAVAW